VVSRVVRIAWYRFRATFHDRWGGYLAIVLLVALLGGLSMGAIAGARRTQSSFPTLLARSNASNLLGLTGVVNQTLGDTNGYDPKLFRAIARLPYVKDVKGFVEMDLLPLTASGSPLFKANGQAMEGSVNGEEFTQDRLIITHGRMANARRADQFVMDSTTERILGFHLGEIVTFNAYSNRQMARLTSGLTPSLFKSVKPVLHIKIKLVGVGAIQATNLVRDQVDTGSSSIILFTPALTDQLDQCCVNTGLAALQLKGGSRHQLAVESEVARLLPKGLPTDFTQLSVIEAKAEQTIRPESIALGVFGLIAALATLIIAGQAIIRRLRLNANDVGVLRALGADPVTTIADGLGGILAAVFVGSLLAAVVAVSLSPLALLGPVRPYIPNGVNADWTVLGGGMVLLLTGLGAMALVGAWRTAPRHSWSHERSAATSRSSAARFAVATNLPISAVIGIRLALEPGVGRNKVPVRSAILGSVFAMMIVISTIIFGTSLHTLVSKPSLYGWNWTYELNGGGGLGDIPAAPAAKLLDQSPYVAAWSGYYFGVLQLDGQSVPVLGGTPGAALSPPILGGHGFNASNEVVLGTATLAQLHKKVGDTVEVDSAGGPTTHLHIVGTATMPTIGPSGSTHLEMGSGALLSYQLIPAGQRNLYNVPPGPNAIFVRVRPGTNAAAAVRSFNAILTKLGGNSNGASVDAVQRPAQIINYGTLGSTPTVLGGALATGAVVALGLTLVASVRRRRRDLALLKTLGCTRRQLAGAIAWQSSTAVGIGAVAGVPLGILLGRFLWDLFAREIGAVPRPTVSPVSIAVIVLGGLILANVVAAIPGRLAARIPTALLLRAE
jgi:hypothetical protein